MFALDGGVAVIPGGDHLVVVGLETHVGGITMGEGSPIGTDVGGVVVDSSPVSGAGNCGPENIDVCEHGELLGYGFELVVGVIEAESKSRRDVTEWARDVGVERGYGSSGWIEPGADSGIGVGDAVDSAGTNSGGENGLQWLGANEVMAVLFHDFSNWLEPVVLGSARLGL